MLPEAKENNLSNATRLPPGLSAVSCFVYCRWSWWKSLVWFPHQLHLSFVNEAATQLYCAFLVQTMLSSSVVYRRSCQNRLRLRIANIIKCETWVNKDFIVATSVYLRRAMHIHLFTSLDKPEPFDISTQSVKRTSPVHFCYSTNQVIAKPLKEKMT